MDWTEFQLLYWFFSKGERVVYLGTPELLRFTILNSKEVYYISPEKVLLKSPRLRKFEENPETFDISLLPKKLDRIINYLPLSLVTSFKVMSKYLNLLEQDKRILIRVNVPKKQAQYIQVMVHDLLPEFKLALVSYLTLEGHKYIIGKKL